MSSEFDPIRSMLPSIVAPTFDRAVAIARMTGELLRALAFWGAILLPLAYVPALAMGRSGLFLALLLIQVACVIVGHDYNRDNKYIAQP